MSALRARCPRCRTLTAVAFDDTYECHSCGATFAAGLVRVPRAWGAGGEPMVEAASSPLPYPEALVVDRETLEEQNAALAEGLPVRPLVVGGCCCAHVGAVRGLAARGLRLGLVWLSRSRSFLKSRICHGHCYTAAAFAPPANASAAGPA